MRQIFVALSLLISLSGTCNAQEPLTLEQCIEHALNHHPAIAIARSDEQMALQDVGTARGRYYPEVGFQTGVRRFETHAFLPAGIGGPGFPSHVGPINDYQLNVRANYVLFDSGLRSSDLQTAEAQLATTQQEIIRTREDITYGVKVAFYNVLQAEDAVTLAKNSRERSKQHLQLAEQRKAAGAVPQADVTRARTEVASAELDVVAAESALRIAVGNLNQTMGRSAPLPLRIERPSLEPVDPLSTDIDQAVTEGSARRPEIQAAKKRADALRSRIGAVRSEILPRLRTEAGYGYRDDDFEQIDKDWWIGVTFTIPLFDGGVRNRRIARSRIEADRELKRVDQLKLGIQQEIWAAYSQWIEAFQALQSSNVMKTEAAETMDLMKARYEEGAGTINDLLDAELAFNQSETQLNNARYRLHIAYATFLRAAGAF